MNIFSSLLSPTVIILATFALCCNHLVSTPDIALALISICTTFIVGINIFDAIKIHHLENKIKDLSGIQDELKRTQIGTNIGFNVAWGVSFLHWQPYTSLLHFIKAYEYALQINDALKAKTCVDCMEKVYKLIKEKKSNNEDILENDKNEIKNRVENIKNETLHKVFVKRINEIINKIL